MKTIGQTVWFETPDCSILHGKIIHIEMDGNQPLYHCYNPDHGTLLLPEYRLFSSPSKAARHADNRHRRRINHYCKQIRSPWHLARFLLQHDIHSNHADPDAREAALRKAREYHMNDTNT